MPPALSSPVYTVVYLLSGMPFTRPSGFFLFFSARRTLLFYFEKGNSSDGRHVFFHTRSVSFKTLDRTLLSSFTV